MAVITAAAVTLRTPGYRSAATLGHRGAQGSGLGMCCAVGASGIAG
jgi:hypothetical protein